MSNPILQVGNITFAPNVNANGTPIPRTVRVKVVKAGEIDHRRAELAYLKSLMAKHPAYTVKFAKELGLSVS